MRQGPHRFARAQNYEAGRKEAERAADASRHRIDDAPMSAVCASLWFDGRMPDDAELARLAGQQVA